MHLESENRHASVGKGRPLQETVTRTHATMFTLEDSADTLLNCFLKYLSVSREGGRASPPYSTVLHFYTTCFQVYAINHLLRVGVCIE